MTAMIVIQRQNRRHPPFASSKRPPWPNFELNKIKTFEKAEGRRD